jgi:PIN domain
MSMPTIRRAVEQSGKNLFLDTNTYLSFYHYSSDDLEELSKLAVLLQQEKLVLYLPRQVVDEFRRNRDAKIADALKRFRDEKLSEFPQMCKDYPEYEAARDALKKYQEAKSRLMEQLATDAAAECLKADQVIRELFDQALQIPVSDEILAAARRRGELGNPPGKPGSNGDAINWECLLRRVPDGEELILVSSDSDYRSLSNDEDLSSFLKREWRETKSAEIVFFKRLSGFFRSRFPRIKLATELEKEILIRELRESSSFAQTRRLLRHLVQHKDLTDQQRNEILDSAVNNTQVYWIITDHDIGYYLRAILLSNTRGLDPWKLQELRRLLGDHVEIAPVEMDHQE